MLLFLILNTRKATAFLLGVVLQGVCYPGGQMQTTLRSPRESPSARPAGRTDDKAAHAYLRVAVLKRSSPRPRHRNVPR